MVVTTARPATASWRRVTTRCIAVVLSRPEVGSSNNKLQNVKSGLSKTFSNTLSHKRSKVAGWRRLTTRCIAVVLGRPHCQLVQQQAAGSKQRPCQFENDEARSWHVRNTADSENSFYICLNFWKRVLRDSFEYKLTY